MPSDSVQPAATETITERNRVSTREDGLRLIAYMMTSGNAIDAFIEKSLGLYYVVAVLPA